MHASQRTIILATAGLLLTVDLGCRTTSPIDAVTVKSSPSARNSEVDAPRSGLRGLFGSRRSDDIEEYPTANTRSTLASQRATKPNPAKPSTTNTAAAPTSNGASFSFSDSAATSNTANKPELTPEEESMLRQAFANSSPEIRALAERRLAAMKATEGDEKIPALPAGSVTPANATDPAEGSVRQANGNSADASAVQPASSTNPAAAAAKPADPRQFAMPDLAATPAASSATPPSPSPAEVAETAPVAIPPAAPAADATPTPIANPAASPAPEATASTPPVPEPAAAAPATPEQVIATLSDDQLLAELIKRHETKLAQSASPSVNQMVAVRTLALLKGTPDEAVKPISSWSQAEQEYFNHQMLTFWQLLDPQGPTERDRRWATALPHLRDATKYLAASTGTLDVRSLQFCKEVLGYGQTVPFEANRFKAGQEVILYCEIENFDAERLSDGYETHLRGSYKILDTTGKPIAAQVLEDDRQTCANFKRDYYLPYLFPLPAQLKPGSYQIELELEDVKGNSRGKALIPLDIIE